MSRFAGILVALSLLAFPAGAAPADEPLEADKAFRPSARLVAETANSGRHGIDVAYRIAPGYYLYRDRIRFEMVPATLPVASPAFPQAMEIEDPFIGRSAIYREQVVIHLPFTASVVDPGRYRLRITAQGCAENRLCYAPFVQELRLDIPPGYRKSDAVKRSLPPGIGR